MSVAEDKGIKQVGPHRNARRKEILPTQEKTTTLARFIDREKVLDEYLFHPAASFSPPSFSHFNVASMRPNSAELGR